MLVRRYMDHRPKRTIIQHHDRRAQGRSGGVCVARIEIEQLQKALVRRANETVQDATEDFPDMFRIDKFPAVEAFNVLGACVRPQADLHT